MPTVVAAAQLLKSIPPACLVINISETSLGESMRQRRQSGVQTHNQPNLRLDTPLIRFDKRQNIQLIVECLISFDNSIFIAILDH